MVVVEATVVAVCEVGFWVLLEELTTCGLNPALFRGDVPFVTLLLELKDDGLWFPLLRLLLL